MFKQLAKSIREYKRDSLLAPLMVTLEVIMEVLIPVMMASLIDKGIEAGNMPYILKLGAAMLAAAVLSLIFGALSGKFAASASAGLAKNLRKDMYYNIQNFSFGNIDRFSTPSLITRLTTDVTNVQNAYQMIVRLLVRSPVMFLSAMCMAFYVNARLALIFLFLTPFLGVGLYLVATRAHPHFVRVFKRYDQLNTVVQENIRGIRVVKSFVREEHEVGKFEERSEEIYDDFVKAEKILAINSPLMQFCIYTSILLVSWIGAHLITSRVMTTGDLMSIFVYIMQILNSLMMLSMVLVMIIISKASAERIVEILSEQSTLSNGPDPVRELSDSSIEFDHVNFSYAKSADNANKLVLRDICLRIEPGETVGILGGTGSSKSSLIHLIPRLYDVTSGSVRVGGVDVRDYDMESLREAIAVVLQKNVLFSGTIKENLRWGNPGATDEELIRACELAQADGFIRTFPQGYDTYIEQGGSNVSGGQKQRLCIARALLKRPKILILDDSTSAVDTKTDALIRRAMREEIPDTTKIIIAQRVASVEDADKVIVLDHGRVDAFGSPAELLRTNRIYQEVCRSQNSEKSDSLEGKEVNGHA